MLMEQTSDAKYMSIIERELSHLIRLSSDLLFFAKPNNQQLHYVNVEMTIQDIIELMDFEARLKNIDMTYYFDDHSNYMIMGNDMYVKQVMLNLVKNAIQAIEQDGSIKIVLKSVTNFVEVTIMDTGCGIDSNHLETIFDMFFTTKELGTGLALPIVKKLMDQLQGTIEVKSTQNLGTHFMLKFPIIQQFQA